MLLRAFAGEVARTSAGVWRAVADAVDPASAADEQAADMEADAIDVDLTEPEPEPEQAAPAVEPGHMIVPIDAWSRVLEQLGHLHEAGQDLAEARERAAKAETENAFLRDQIRDLKAQSDRPKRRPAAPAEPAPEPAASPTTAAAPEPAPRRQRLRRAREAAGRWISPS